MDFETNFTSLKSTQQEAKTCKDHYCYRNREHRQRSKTGREPSHRPVHQNMQKTSNQSDHQSRTKTLRSVQAHHKSSKQERNLRSVEAHHKGWAHTPASQHSMWKCCVKTIGRKTFNHLGIPHHDAPISGAGVYEAIAPPLHTGHRSGVARQREHTSPCIGIPHFCCAVLRC